MTNSPLPNRQTEFSFKNTLLQVYRAKLEQTKENFQEKSLAVSHITAALKAHRERKNLNYVKSAAIVIQSVYRRRVAVFKTQDIYNATQFQLRQKYYADMATKIQKTWRAHVIREHVLDITQRRKQIEQIALASAEQIDMCRQYAEICETVNLQKRVEDQAKLVQQMSKIHHMVSTKAIPGVFNPQFPVLPPTIGGKSVDQILKEEGRRAVKMQRTTPVILNNLGKCMTGEI